MNLFENIFDKFTKQAQPMPSFGTPQAPRTNSYVAPNMQYSQGPQNTGIGMVTQPKPINTSLPMGIPEPVFQKDPSDELKKEFGFNDTDIEFLRQAKQEGYDSDMAFEYITKKKQQEKQNIYSGDPSVDNTFMNVVGGAIAEIPKVAGEVGSFLGKASQYMPANLLGTALEAGFTDKTYGQLREEQKAQAEQLATAGQAGKEFVQKYGSYNPESTGAKVGETITDIGSAFVGPNKAKILKEGTGFVKGILPKTLNLASEGALAGAKYDVATKGEITKEGVGIGAGGNIVAGGILGGGKKIIGALKGKTPEETLIAKLGQEKTKGIVKGKVVNVPVPEKGIIETVTMGVGRPNDPKVLAGRALTPSYAGKTPKQIVNTTADVEKNTRKLWEGIRTGKYKGDISTLEDAANTVVTNLERIGASIGDDIKGAVGKVKPSTETTNIIRSTLKNKIEKRSGAYSTLKNFLTDTSKGLNVQDAMKAKRVYQTEIGKLIRSGDAGTDSYSALVKGVQELSDNIDAVVEKSIGSKAFLEKKAQYSHLKKIVSDIAKSASVEGRRSPQTFVEQLGMVESLMEGVKNPLSTAGRVFAKEIGELNTRGGAWKELIKIYDTEAIKAMKGKKPIVKPNSTTNAKQQVSNANASDTIPEGYFKNAFGEIQKNPSNKKGGFIKIPELGKKSIVKSPDSGLKKEVQDLAVLHNLSLENIKKINELGGLPGPSLAVTKKTIPFEDFGDITLVGDKDLIQSMKAKTYSADIYSPRVPQPDIKYKNPRIVSEISKKTGIDEWKVDSDIKDGYYQSKEEYKPYINEIEKSIEKRIFKGFTYSGNRKYSAYNLDNVIKEMFSKGNKGAESSMFSGNLSQTMGKEAKTLNIKDIKKAKIESSPELDKKYQSLKDEWSDIVGWDGASAINESFTSKGNPESILRKLHEYSDGTKFTLSDVKRLQEIATEATNLPKTYLETKFTRSVGLNEFKGVIAPVEQIPELKQLLKGTGLEDKIVGYKQGESRMGKLEELQKKYGNIFFNIGGAYVGMKILQNYLMGEDENKPKSIIKK